MVTVKEIYDILLVHYGTPPWWSEDPFEVMVGSVLVQNTAWSNVQKVISSIGKSLTPQYISGLPLDELEEVIRPCGFCKAKAACLKRLTAWYGGYGYDQQKVMALPEERVGAELLAIKGIGRETKDVILLYAFYFPTFVIDAYTKRLAERLQLPVELEYGAMQRYFEDGLEREALLFGNYHWLILTHAITYCKKKPKCKSCPFKTACEYK